MQDLIDGGPPAGVALKDAVDQVAGQRADRLGHAVLVLLDARVRLLEALGLERRPADQQSVPVARARGGGVRGTENLSPSDYGSQRTRLHEQIKKK